ncbi:flavodoxin [Acinetobacter johnsonii]|jgi:flavodoxin|uniref:Flavodoxin n=1 Tax=Acinetobacter johnsonii TaxID=40214 RepID=A0A3S9AK83_ACIJO|nr:flavodoxin [Acinetobacter johnsonii]AZN64015.1 flavodoxin [Acinetobacter johnsonii]
MIASMRFILFFVCAMGLMGCPSAENSQTAQNMAPSPNPPVNTDNPKALIVYLSRTKNTEALAKMVQEKVGGDLVALELQTPYPENYQAIVRQVDQENQDGYLPPLKTQVENIGQYDVIFVGFPTWDMQLPPPIKSFLNQYHADLNGKMIVPFNNNAGYGMGQSLAQFNQYCRGCQIMQSIELRGGIERDGILFVMEGERANQAKNEIAQWLQDLSVNNPVIQQLLQNHATN